MSSDESSESSSDEELRREDEILLLALLLNRKRKIWVHDTNKRRSLFGEYHHLVDDLQDRFYIYFRMSKEHFEELHCLLKNKLRKKSTNWRKAIGTRERLAICLRYLSTGDSYTTISFSYRVGISTVATIVKETCELIWEILQPLYMPTPTEETWRTNELGYRQNMKYPNCVGTIDGKHVYLKCPPNSGSAFFCYKKRFSLILLGIVDPNYRFTVIDVGGYGKDSDNTIFESSAFYQEYILGKEILPPKPLPGFNDPMPHVLLGDEGFALEKYIMRPYDKRSATINEDMRTYNSYHNRARRISENAFGILVQKRRVFHRPIECEINTACSLVKTACCLHNFLRSKNIVTLDECHTFDTSTISLSVVTPLGANTRRSNMEAYRVRDKFKTYFNVT